MQQHCSFTIYSDLKSKKRSLKIDPVNRDYKFRMDTPQNLSLDELIKTYKTEECISRCYNPDDIPNIKGAYNIAWFDEIHIEQKGNQPVHKIVFFTNFQEMIK